MTTPVVDDAAAEGAESNALASETSAPHSGNGVEDETTEAVVSPLGRPDAGSSVSRSEGTGSRKQEGGAVDSGTDSLP